MIYHKKKSHISVKPYLAGTGSDQPLPQVNSKASLTRLNTVGLSTSSTHLDITRNDNGQLQKWKVDYYI